MPRISTGRNTLTLGVRAKGSFSPQAKSCSCCRTSGSALPPPARYMAVGSRSRFFPKTPTPNGKHPGPLDPPVADQGEIGGPAADLDEDPAEVVDLVGGV